MLTTKSLKCSTTPMFGVCLDELDAVLDPESGLFSDFGDSACMLDDADDDGGEGVLCSK